MEIEHDEQNAMFYMETKGDKPAKMTYVLRDREMVIEHTVVDKALRGQNIGIKLVASAVEFARDNGLRILPECSYAKKILEENPEYKDVLIPMD